MEPSRVTLEEAQELFQICMPGIKKEEKPAADCLGQILAEPVYAAVTQPPFPRSAMDGFALRSRDVCGADLEHPVTLEVAGCVYAGQKTELILEPHQAVRIMTGAMIPEGADCVVKQEDTDYVRIADPDPGPGKQSKFIIMWDREKITARKEKIFLPGNCWQKPDFW